jgi:hypothetical protein
MFLLFKKILNSDPTQRGDIIVRADSILLYNEDVLENRKLGVNYTATRVELASFPNHSFYTPSTLAQVSSVLKVIDMTSGAGTGSTCAGDPGVLDILYVPISYPLLKTSMIVNNIEAELQDVVFSPDYLVFSENIIYRDQRTGQQKTALMVVLRDSQQRRVMTNLEFSDLQAVLDPTPVPI